MSTARVNLLPREFAERARSRRVVGLTGGAVALYVVLLGVLYVQKMGDVNDAERERDAAQAQVTLLESELAQLQQFQVLADQLEQRETLLTQAMRREVSFARILNDLSLSFPGTSSLRNVSLSLTDELTPTPGTAGTATTPADPLDDADPLVDGPTIATIVFDGYSIERFAPGVESVLLELDEVRSFFDSFVTAAQSEEIGETEVTGFNGSVDLDPSAYTRRYLEGLPPEDGLQ